MTIYAHVSLEEIKAIGVDEILHRRGSKTHGGPRYLTVVYQIDQGLKRLLWIGQDRREERSARQRPHSSPNSTRA